MIEVIKHGQKKFKAICINCGCEFTYELSDMHPLGGVNCPDCGKRVAHKAMASEPICAPITCPPKTMLFDSQTATEGDVYTTEKDLEIQQMFKDQMSKTMAIPCAEVEK